MIAIPRQTRPLLSEEDILRGMEALRGYVDLTPQDFGELYAVVHELARERLLRERTAADVMTAPAVAIAENASIEECIRLLARANVSGLPVLDGQNRLSGVVSEKDVLRLLGKTPEAHLMRLVQDSIHTPLHPEPAVLQERVRAAMTRNPLTAGPQTPLGELARIFEQYAVNRLPVADASGAVSGIVTRADVIRAFAELA